MPKANENSMRHFIIIFLFLCGIQQIGICQNELTWKKVTSFSKENLPLENLDGSIYGFHNGAVLIASGAEIMTSDTLQYSGYQWINKVFVFVENEFGSFEEIENYFVIPFDSFAVFTSVQTSKGLVCIGSTSPKSEDLLAFLLKWNNDLSSVEIDSLPSLKKPKSYLAGEVIGDKVFVIGDFDDQFDFLTFDLSDIQSDQKWEPVKRFEGPTRLAPILASQSNGLDNCLFVFGGKEPAGKYLNDSYQFNPKTNSWKQLVGVPFKYGKSDKLIENAAFPIGSTDILYFNKAARKSYLYHAITDTWENVGSFPIREKLYYFLKKGNNTFALVFPEKRNDESDIELFELSFENEKQRFGFLNVFVLVFYFVLLIFLGIYFSAKQKDSDDYFKGGKKIPWWAAGLSLYGTGLSAISFMAVPAKTYATDWAYFMTKLPQILIPVIVCWLFIPFFRKLDITTAYEYLEKRFNLATRLIGSISFIIFQLGRIGIVLYLPAIALNVATGFDIIFCISLMGVISLIYTIMGGIEAVIWTDVMQVIILIGGIILCLILISFSLEGGVMEIIEVGNQNEKFEILNMAFDFKQPTFWVVVLGGFFSQLIVYSSDQSMVQRYLTTKDIKGAKRSIWTSTLVSLSIGWIFFFVGTALFAFYKANPPELLPAMQSTDAIFPWYIFSQLPDGVNGLLIAGIFAAAMSSLSSSMNSAATAYTVDFHQKFNWKGDALFVGRSSTFIIGIAGILIALLFATMDVKSIWDEFLKIIGLITGGLGGVFLLGIISTRANGIGALAGLFGSGLVQFLVSNYQPVHFLLYTATGFVSCLIIGYVVSLFFSGHSKPLAGLTIYTNQRKK